MFYFILLTVLFVFILKYFIFVSSARAGQHQKKSDYMGHCLEFASEYALCPNLPHQQLLI